ASVQNRQSQRRHQTRRQKHKTRLGGGSLAQISTMDKYVAWLPSPGQRFSKKKFLYHLSAPMRRRNRHRLRGKLKKQKPASQRVIGANQHNG
ncbi:hypothetical protein, partial [Mesorhizobium carmichaelinearum]|uniref:hypothetical protein n=1 Tax=Mesorhizobium carmichaelinearum TaxID=1208188 RepID=UPI001AECAA6C